MQELKLANGDINAEAAGDWVCMEWGTVGGPAAREAALWVQLQREFCKRNLLPAQAIKRLDALNFQWEPKVLKPSISSLSKHCSPFKLTGCVSMVSYHAAMSSHQGQAPQMQAARKRTDLKHT